jgi:hypothetical protein
MGTMDEVLHMVTKSTSQMIVKTKKKVVSVFPPLVAANPTKTTVRKSTCTSGQRQNGILDFMTIPMPRHAVDDGLSIVAHPKQVDEVMTKQVMTIPTGQDVIVLNTEDGTIESALTTTDDGEVSAGVNNHR